MPVTIRAIFALVLLALTTSCSGDSDSNSTPRLALVTKDTLIESLPNACTLLDESLAEQILGSAVGSSLTMHNNNAMSQCSWYPAGGRSPAVTATLIIWTRSQLDPEKQGADFSSTIAGYFSAEFVRRVDDIGRWAGLLKNKQGEYRLYIATPYFLDIYSHGVATHGVHMTVSHGGLTDPDNALGVLEPIALELLNRIGNVTATETRQ